MSTPANSEAGEAGEASEASEAAFDARLRAHLAATAPAQPDAAFRAALRSTLQHTVAATAGEHRRNRRRNHHQDHRQDHRQGRWSRRRTLTLSAVVLAGLGGGSAALASGLLPTPGADRVVLRTPATTVIHTGTATVDLGARPADTTSVELTLTCLSAGTFTFADGASMSCNPTDVPPDISPADETSAADATSPGQPSGVGSAGYTLPLREGQTSTTITATAGAKWSLTSAYSTRTPTDWATNAAGESYGITKPDGSGDPDLIAVAATTSTGEQGYVYARDLEAGQPTPTSPEEAATWSQEHPPTPHDIPVYAADGSTVIGRFKVQ